MRLEARERLQADKELRNKRGEIQDKIDTINDKISSLKKGLPSRNNSMKVSQENQINKRLQIIKEHEKIQQLRKQKLRYREK